MKFNELIDEYHRNKPAFLDRYKNKQIELECKITKIERTFFHNVYITMDMLRFTGWWTICIKVPKNVDWSKFYIGRMITIAGKFHKFCWFSGNGPIWTDVVLVSPKIIGHDC